MFVGSLMTLQAAVRPAPTLFVLILVSMAQPIGMNMYLPAIADIRVDLSTSAAMVQLTLSLYLAATAIGQLVIGPASDIYGRRPVLLAGMATFVAGSLVCASAETIEVLIAGRVVQAIGGCAGISLARAMVRDIYGAEASASMIGYVTMGMAVAPLITPVLGGLVHEAAGFGVLVFVVAYLRLGETRPRGGTSTGFTNWAREAGRLMKLRDFWIFAGSGAILSAVFFSFIAGGPVVSTEVFGLSPSMFGLYFVMITVGYISGNFLAGRLSRRLGVTRMIRLGSGVCLVAVGCVAVLFRLGASHPVALFVPTLFAGLGNGIALPNAISGAISVRPDLAGTAAGLSGAFQVGAGAVVAVIVGLLLDLEGDAHSVWPLVMPMLTSAVLSAALALVVDDARLRASPPPPH